MAARWRTSPPPRSRRPSPRPSDPPPTPPAAAGRRNRYGALEPRARSGPAAERRAPKPLCLLQCFQLGVELLVPLVARGLCGAFLRAVFAGALLAPAAD